jgi:opacity protein-like surface antigen
VAHANALMIYRHGRLIAIDRNGQLLDIYLRRGVLARILSRNSDLFEDGVRGSQAQTKRRSDRTMKAAKILPVLLMLAPTTAVGQGDDRSGPYGEFRGGGLFVADSNTKLSGTPGSHTADFDAGFAIAGAVGYRFNRHLRAEVEAGYRQAEIGELTIPGLGRLDGDWDIGVVTTLVNVIYDIDYRDAPVVPYVGGGFGYGLAMLDSDAEAALRMDASSAELAWNLLAGVRFRVTGNALLSVGYRYLETTDPDFDGSAGWIASEFSSHEVFAGIGYEF